MSTLSAPKDQPKRVEKTLEMQLADLDDNLYLLGMAAEGVRRGELAFLKILAVLLRSTVCFSSGTEGLLWRLRDRLGFDDTVIATACLGIDTELANAKNMHCMHWYFSPHRSYGHLVPQPISLKVLIKERTAFHFGGNNVTHQDVILKIAQQMGGAHEVERVQANVADLFETFMADASSAAQILLDNATYVLGVGERALQAGATHGYARLPHATYRIRNIGADSVALARTRWRFTTTSDLPPEGGTFLAMEAPKLGWLTDGQEYDASKLHSGPLTFSIIKRSSGEFLVQLSGLDDIEYRWVAPLSPESNNKNVNVIVNWTRSTVSLFTKNGFMEQSRQLSI